MKKFLLLFLLFTYPLQSQAETIYFSTENQIEYLQSNPNLLKDENGNDIFNSNVFDTLILNGDFGYSVSSAGDVNGDGYSDVIVGSNIDNYPNNRWRAYIFYGGIEMNNIADVTLTGALNTDIVSVSSAGDVNGDGYSDIIIGALYRSSYYAIVHLFYGGTTMDINPDFSFYPEGRSSGLRFSVSTAGDVNADGYSDLIIGVGSEEFVTSPPGKAFLFYGGSEGIHYTPDVIFSGVYNGDKYGQSVCSVGDINDDGFSDVAVSSIYYNSFSGCIYIYYGGINMNNNYDILLTGEFANDSFGKVISSAGDVNGDGFSDVFVTSTGYNINTGRSYIYYGGLDMNNMPDVIMTGDTLYGNFGNSISLTGDINGDGYSDVIIGNRNYSSSKGRIYMYYGGSSMNNSADIIIDGEIGFNIFGNSVSTAGDLNGDSYPDIIVSSNGRAYIYFPKPDIKINVKVLMEGTYNPVFNQKTRKDSVTVQLRNFILPFAIMDSTKITIDSNSFIGNCKFTHAPSGNYYLVVKHFNSIETWSKVGGDSFSTIGIYNYDFTSTISKAYSNNLKLKGSKYCIFSGDINQDGFISLFDVIPIYNDASNFLSGNYLPTDLTGEGIVDLTDVTICYNNSANFVSIKRP